MAKYGRNADRKMRLTKCGYIKNADVKTTNDHIRMMKSSQVKVKVKSNSIVFRIFMAVKGQNCSFFDKSMKLGRVTNLYKTNIS